MFSIVDHSLAKLIFQTVSKVYGGGYRSLQYAKRLIPLLNQHDYGEELFSGFLINERFTTTAFREVVRQTSPDYPVPTDLNFRLYNVEKSNAPEELGTSFTFETETNFDIKEFEKYLYNSDIEGHTNFSVTFMMQAAAAIQDVDVASQFKSELSSEESSAPIIQKAILNLDQYKANNSEAITEFNEHIITNCPSVADAIDSGMRSFDDFMHLFERSQQFREWIRQAPDDSDHNSIINEYMKANEAEVFTGSKLYKALKFVAALPITLVPIVLPNQTELANDALNLIVGSTADSYIDFISNRFNHWKPSQFVKSDLNNFLKS
jgi:hypothetical protein